MAGAAGVTEDRAAALDGVPIKIVFEVYDISKTTVATRIEFENVVVSLVRGRVRGLLGSGAVGN